MLEVEGGKVHGKSANLNRSLREERIKSVENHLVD